MTNQEQLKLYKKALWDYIICFFRPSLKYRLAIDGGFCKYFCSKNIMTKDLVFLNQQKPKTLWYHEYWFKFGELLPRIKCLIKAIKACKQSIKKEKYE
jgi:hypothetical protein